MQNMVRTDEDWGLDVLLDIVFSLLEQTTDLIRIKKSASLSNTSLSPDLSIDTTALANILIIVEGLVENFQVCVKLLASTDVVSIFLELNHFCRLM